MPRKRKAPPGGVACSLTVFQGDGDDLATMRVGIEGTKTVFKFLPSSIEAMRSKREEILDFMERNILKYIDADKGESASHVGRAAIVLCLVAAGIELDLHMPFFAQSDRDIALDVTTIVIKVYIDATARQPEDLTIPAAQEQLAQALKAPAWQVFLAYSIETRERLGLPDIAVSLACIPLSTHLPPCANNVKVFKRSYTRDNALDQAKTIVPDLRSRVLESFPARLLAHAASRFVEDPSLDVKALVAAACHDEVTYQHGVLSVRDVEKGTQAIWKTSETSVVVKLPTREFALDAIRTAEEVIDTQIRSEGRDWWSSAANQLSTAQIWRDSVLEALGGCNTRSLSKERREILESTWCSGTACAAGPHRCAAYPSEYHDLHDDIPCGQMAGHVCRRHAAYLKTRYFVNGDDWHRDKWCKDTVLYDRRRGVKTTEGDLQSTSWKTALLAPDEVSFQVRQSIADVLCSIDPKPEEIVKLCPALSLQAITTKPSPESPAPLAIEVVDAIQAMRPSLDLQMNFNASGCIQGHNVDSVRLVPKFFQRRQSGHPLSAMLVVLGMQINSTAGMPQKTQLLDDIARVIDALVPIEVAYLNARSGRPLPDALRDGAREGHELLEEGYKCRRASALLALKPSDAGGPDVEATITNMLQVSPGKDSACNEAREVWNTLDDPLEESQRDELLAKVEASDPKRSIPRNLDGFPVFWFPETTSTALILKLAKLAWVRVITECDLVTITICGADGADGWWVVILIWARYYTRYTDRDAISGLPLRLSGVAHHPLKPTLVAHTTHRRSIAESNGTVQGWMVNQLIASSRVSRILQWLSSSRPACTILLHRLQEAGLVDLAAAQLDALKERSRLDDAFVETIRLNGKQPYE